MHNLTPTDMDPSIERLWKERGGDDRKMAVLIVSDKSWAGFLHMFLV